jgi:hypothetical protein
VITEYHYKLQLAPSNFAVIVVINIENPIEDAAGYLQSHRDGIATSCSVDI